MMTRPHLLDALRDRVLLCDGGMGSRVQALTLDIEKDYWGRENCTDVLVLEQFRPANEVAHYYAAVKSISLVAFVYYSVASAVAHRFSACHAAGDHAALAAIVASSVRWIFWPSLAATLVILAAGRPVLSLFGPQFVDAYPIMFVLAVGLPSGFAIGTTYASNSELGAGTPNEWEPWVRVAWAFGRRAGLAGTGAYNTATESANGELGAGWTWRRISLLGAARVFSSAFGSDASEAALAAGFLFHLTSRLAVGGDFARVVT